MLRRPRKTRRREGRWNAKKSAIFTHISITYANISACLCRAQRKTGNKLFKLNLAKFRLPLLFRSACNIDQYMIKFTSANQIFLPCIFSLTFSLTPPSQSEPPLLTPPTQYPSPKTLCSCSLDSSSPPGSPSPPAKSEPCFLKFCSFCGWKVHETEDSSMRSTPLLIQE